MGGDINKWLKGHNGISSYVGVDIAFNSLKHFVNERLSAYNKEKYKFTKLICADIGSESLISSTLHVHTWDSSGSSQWCDAIPLTVNDKFDLVSCQFAFHYMFQSRQKAKHFLDEVSRHLKPGGLFVVTTIDSRVVADMILQQYASSTKGSKLRDHNSDISSSSSEREMRLVITDEFDSKLLTITFKDDHWQHLTEIGASQLMKNNEIPFGIQYDFNLHDSDDMAAVNAPEWLVPSGSPLHQLADECGLTVQSNHNFHQFVESNMTNSSYREHMENRGVFNYKGTMSSAEWAIARLYTVIVFERKFENGNNPSKKTHLLDARSANTSSSMSSQPETVRLRPISPSDSPPPSPSNAAARLRPISPSDSPPPSPSNAAARVRPISPSDSPPPSPSNAAARVRPISPSDSPPPSPPVSGGTRSPLDSPPPSPRTPPTAPPPHLKRHRAVYNNNDDDGGPVYAFDD
jgi:SAM-dependent methyltransferase